jgi:hypothetical protein
MDELSILSSRLKAKADNAYYDMINLARRDECLGWEIKVERGEFGHKELDAHCARAEQIGRHRALMEVRNEIGEILKNNPAPAGGGGE